MSFSTAEVTLFGIVRFDRASSQHRLVGVQTNPLVLICNETGNGSEWGIQSVSAGLPLLLFEAARDSAVPSNNQGTLALNFFPGVETIDAALFVGNGSVTVSIQVPGTTGDGTFAEVHDLTVHLRALAGRELILAGGNTRLRGTGMAPTPLAASGNAASTPGILPAWTSIFWSSPTAGVSFAPVGAGTTKNVNAGAAGPVVLEFASSDPAPAFDVASAFDGSSSVVLPGSSKSVDCGDSGLLVIEDATDPVVAFTNFELEVGVSPGSARNMAFQIEITDDDYFSLTNVTITFNYVRRNDLTPVASTTYSYDTVTGNFTTTDVVPAGLNITVPAPVVSDSDRPQVDHSAWGGVIYAAAEHSTSAMTCGNIQVQIQDGRFESLEVMVSVTDHSGNNTSESRETLIAIPTDIMLCLDYSGSMSSPPEGGGAAPVGVESKWDAAKAAANRFHAVYRAISPAIGGVDSLTNRVGYVRFYWDDSTGTDASSTEVALQDVEASPPAAGALVSDGNPAWLQFTPIAEGIKRCVTALTAGGDSWRRRVVIAMTDGYENRGALINDIRTTTLADPNFIENTIDDPQNGIVIHSCAFGQDAGMDADKMNWLATGSDGNKGFGGEYHSTATALTSDAAKALTTNFLNALVASIPSVELIGAVDASGGMLMVDPNVRRVVFIITSEDAATLNGPAGMSVTDTGSAGGVRWWILDTPPSGNYFVTGIGPGIVDFHGVVDLQLRSQFSVVGPSGVGTQQILRATIRDGGRPVSGAQVWARATVPGRSDGETAYRLSRVLAAAKIRKLPHINLSPDGRSRKAILASVAQLQFGLPLAHHVTGGAIRLWELPNHPGTYEARFDDTSKEGSYGFSFSASGSMIDGGHFSRSRSMSKYLTPTISPGLTGLSWIPGAIRDNVQQWTAVLQPVSVTGYALGGGQDLAALVAGMKRETPLQDRLDGRYSASVSVPVGEPLPAVRLLHAGSSVEVTGLTQALPVRRVRVVLEKLQIIDAQESHTDPGEFVFETVVAPASARDRAVRRRFPEQGELKLNDDQSLELKAVIFDGLIEDGSSMVVSVGAVEFDFFPDTTRTTSLPSYRRTFSGPPTDWAGRYVPGDEKHDQEDLRDWKIWYRVEVH